MIMTVAYYRHRVILKSSFSCYGSGHFVQFATQEDIDPLLVGSWWDSHKVICRWNHHDSEESKDRRESWSRWTNICHSLSANIARVQVDLLNETVLDEEAKEISVRDPNCGFISVHLEYSFYPLFLLCGVGVQSTYILATARRGSFYILTGINAWLLILFMT